MVAHARSSPRHKKGTVFAFKLILLGAALGTTLAIVHAQGRGGQKRAAPQLSLASGKETFLKYCASCHGGEGKGDGPVASALNPPPTNLTRISKENDGKYPAGLVAALLKFGRNLAAHGSQDMPVWGSLFKAIDPVHDPTGQKHVDDVVAYIESLQIK